MTFRAVWILDPVDGTTNLIHDFRCSALSLALCDRGQLELGIIYQPIGMSCFWHSGAGERFSTEAPSMSALSVIWDRA